MQLSKPNYKVFSTILLGFFLFGLHEFALIVSEGLPRIIAFIGLLFIFVSPIWFKYKRVSPLKGNVKILFYIYLFWIVVIILQPLFNGQGYSIQSIHPYANYGLTSYLLPFIVLLGVNNISLVKIFRIIFVFSLIGFVFFVVNFNNMQSTVLTGMGMSIDGEMGIGELANNYYFWFSISSLSLLCYEFVPKKYKWTAIFTSIFTLFLITYLARRSGIFMLVLYFFGMYFLYLEQPEKKHRFPKIILVVAIISIIFSIVKNYSDSTFSLIFSRLDEDSRSSVDEAIITYLNTENAWLFGKGIEGAYKHPDFDEPRYTHETGYLYLIIKGGIIYLFLYVSLLLHAAYLGFFKTKNRLTKALALYAFFHIVFLIPYGLPDFGLEYLFVWIAFALCETPNLRSMTNQQVKNYLARN
jgi:hypothetical protein